MMTLVAVVIVAIYAAFCAIHAQRVVKKKRPPGAPAILAWILGIGVFVAEFVTLPILIVVTIVMRIRRRIRRLYDRDVIPRQRPTVS